VAGDYLELLDTLDEALEHLEREVLERPSERTVAHLYRLRRELAHLRRMISPQREVLNRLSWDSFPVVREDSRPYFREVYDRLSRVLDQIDNLRDLAVGALETYLSIVNNRLNETMRWLAAVSTLFLPLTLVASIYGMNFPDLPPFGIAGGWRLVVAGMVGLAVLIRVWFRRRGWL
jgi:magnesium transporter